MLRLWCLLLLVPFSYGQENTTHAANSSLHSALVDLIGIKSPKQEDVNSTSLQKASSIIPNADPEMVTKQTDTTASVVSEKEECSDSGVENGICVPYYTCNSTIQMASSSDIIDIPVYDTRCTSYIDICCSPENVIIIDSPTVKPDVIGDQAKVNKSCGHRNPDGVGRKFFTEQEHSTSAFGEFPWTVAILRIASVSDIIINVYVGSGSLIHPNVVLTGGHVVHKYQELNIRAGEWDTQTTKEMYSHQDRDVKEVVLHPDFNSKNLHNDVALLFLSGPVDISPPHIGVACLPNDNDVDYSSKAMCFASGWGKEQFGKEGRYSVVLKKVELPLVAHETCEEQLRQTRLGTRFQLDSSFICAGGELGKDTCVGDGGAPLVCPVKDGEDKYVQTGIVAWGINCGSRVVPAVYVNVGKFRRWIDENVVKRGYDSEIYNI